jgi:hypothetical protein
MTGLCSFLRMEAASNIVVKGRGSTIRMADWAMPSQPRLTVVLVELISSTSPNGYLNALLQWPLWPRIVKDMIGNRGPLFSDPVAAETWDDSSGKTWVFD